MINPLTGKVLRYKPCGADSCCYTDNRELVEKMLQIVEAVSMIGVDFGHGHYALEDKYIEMAREIKTEQEKL